MNLKAKTTSFLCGTLVASAIVLGVLYTLVVAPTFEKLEDRDIRQATARSFDALAARSTALADSLADWAAWDDTYNYAHDRNQAFYDANLIPTSMKNAGATAMVIVDESGTIVFGQSQDGQDTPSHQPLPEGFSRVLAPESPFMQHAALDAAVHGVVMLEGKPMLVASRQITTSLGEGPSHGVLFFTQWLDDDMVASLSQALYLGLDIKPVDNTATSTIPRVLSETAHADSWFHEPAGVATQTLDADIAQGSMVIADAFGDPVLTLRASVKRDIHDAASSMARVLLISGACVLLLVVFASGYSLHRLVVSRVVRLRQEVAEITGHTETAKDVSAQGEDEIGSLARSINTMLHSLRAARNQAEAAVRAKTLFLANMSHEIRTPMTAIMGFTDVLIDEAHNPSERLNAALTIKRSGNHLLTIINDILDVSKIEAGKMTYERTSADPLAILEDVRALMAAKALEKGVSLRVCTETLVPERISTDTTRLKQALLNLVGNAVKFTPRGEVCLGVSYDGATKLLRIDVRDSGIGMTPEQAANLFRPFAQAEASTTRKFGGTGLGLCISRHIAQALGGDITVASEAGTGSTFSLTIDVGDVSGVAMIRERAPEAAPAPAPAPVTTRLSGRVLLVEDGPDNQRLIRMILTKAGAEVTIACNGLEGFQAAIDAVTNAKPFDIVLMDMQMPVMDGYTAARKLREHGYTGQIMALTAHAFKEEIDKCLHAGCDAFQTKPVNKGPFLLELSQRMGKPSTWNQGDHRAAA